MNGGDAAPGHYETPKGFSLSINTKSAPEADVIFRELAIEGRVLLPLERRFGRSGSAWSSTASGSRG